MGYCKSLDPITKTMTLNEAKKVHTTNTLKIVECYRKQADLVDAYVRRYKKSVD